jgi:histidine triad (HIT) family protein
MQESLFTKIIKGEIPSHKIYEDDFVYAFLDIYPVAEGHTLVIPKQQTEFVWDLDDSTYQHLTQATKKIALRLREVLNVQYVGQKIVGTDVPHAHIHLIPFNQTKEFQAHSDTTKEPDHTALAVLAARIRLSDN